jgi:hypothetical protein
MDLYDKILNILLTLRDTAEHFKIRSAQDIKKLIKAKMDAKTLKEPKDLGKLYELEKMIADLRESLAAAKSNSLL